jgi:hypothetical protein
MKTDIRNVFHGALSGTWASSSGSLHMCPTTNSLTIRSDVEIASPIGTIKNSTTIPGVAEPQAFSYNCQGNTLVISTGDDQGGTLVWSFRRK